MVTEYDEMFFEEAFEQLESAAEALVEAEKSADWRDAVDLVFRAFHSIKGGAQMVGLEEIEELLHELENILTEIRNETIEPNTEVISVLLDAIAVIETDLGFAQRGANLESFGQRHDPLLLRIKELNPNSEPSKAEQIFQAKPSKRRMVALYFALSQDAPMPEVTAVLLEKQYQETGNLLHMGLGTDRSRQVVVGSLETEMNDEELKRLCTVSYVDQVHICAYGQCIYAGVAQEELPKLRLKVLLVEDNAVLLLTLQRVLQKTGFDVSAVTSAEEALPLIESEGFQVLITDIQLPGIDGLELARQAKKRFSLIQIIVITAETTISKATEALELGASEYLLKPLDMRELIRAVEQSQNRLVKWWDRLHKWSAR